MMMRNFLAYTYKKVARFVSEQGSQF